MTPLLPVAAIVLAKQPRPGRVKTRLCPPLTPTQAARLAAASLEQTLVQVRATPFLSHHLVLEGDYPASGFQIHPQRPGELPERIAGAFEDVMRGPHPLPTLLVGMDTPQLTPELLTQAATALLDAGSVLGLASDGGWWALGLSRPDPELVLSVPTSTSTTGIDQLTALREAGLTPHLLPELTDMDTWEDACALAEALPGTHFQAAHAKLTRAMERKRGS